MNIMENLAGQGKRWLEDMVLPQYLPTCRWFGGKARKIVSISLGDMIEFGDGGNWALLIVDVEYAEGEKPKAESGEITKALSGEKYFLPLASTEAAGQKGEYLQEHFPQAVMGERDGQLFFDAVYDKDFRSSLLKSLVKNEKCFVKSDLDHKSVIKGISQFSSSNLISQSDFNFDDLESFVLKAEQSNTALIYPGICFLKILRRLEMDENPELEILRFLKSEGSFKRVPEYLGALEYRNSSDQIITLGIAETLIDYQDQAWPFMVQAAKNFIDDVYRRDSFESSKPEPIADKVKNFAAILGKRTAEMHLALASQKGLKSHTQGEPPDFSLVFSPELASTDQKLALVQQLIQQGEKTFSLLTQIRKNLSPEQIPLADQVLNAKEKIFAHFSEVKDAALPIWLIRIHGDYHLGQVLCQGDDVVILDFEGEPARPIKERKMKQSPWRDITGMLRSFHYAIHVAFSEVKEKKEKEAKEENEGNGPEEILEALEYWHEAMSQIFLKAYLDRAAWAAEAAEAPFLGNENQRASYLRIFTMQKALYELEYELNNRPGWAFIPLQGILRIL